MKKLFSYLSLFICAFMLCGNVLIVNAAEYDVYETGQSITKEMTSGKKVQFTVIEDQGKNSQYVKVVANPANLEQFGVTPAYSYNDISAAITSQEWDTTVLAFTDKLEELWSKSGTIKVDNNNMVSVFSLDQYNDFVDKYAKAKYGNTYSNLTADNQAKVNSEIKGILSGQSFWIYNKDSSTNTLLYDRIVNGEYTNAEMDESAKGNAINLTVSATICKTPKQTSTNPDTADNNVLFLTIIAAGCVICIVGFGRKILAR